MNYTFELMFENDLSKQTKDIVLDRIEFLKDQLYETAIVIQAVEEGSNKNSIKLVFESILNDEEITIFMNKFVEMKSVLWIEYRIILLDLIKSSIPKFHTYYDCSKNLIDFYGLVTDEDFKIEKINPEVYLVEAMNSNAENCICEHLGSF